MSSRRKRRRFTRQERLNSIYRRIYSSTIRNKPLTIAQVARLERISKSTAYAYVRYLRRKLERKGNIRIKMLRVKKKRFLVYENLAVKEAALLREQPTKAAWELRGTVRYDQGPGRGIDINVVILIPDRDKATVDRGITRIQETLGDHNFGTLVKWLDFGISPATPQSRPFFNYRHSGDAT